MPAQLTTRRSPWLVAVIALAAGYWFGVRRRFDQWGGATPEELARQMPGDALISDPTDTGMMAITVDAPPEDIWPWLVQIGYQRGGLYSYDWLDRLFGFLDRPSATRVLPEFQQLAVGDKIPWDKRGTEMTAALVEPPRALALSLQTRGFLWVWQFVLYPIEDRRTRFVSRGTQHVPSGPLWWVFMRISEPAAFIMTHRFMLGVKRRAEALHAQRAQARRTEAEPASAASRPTPARA